MNLVLNPESNREKTSSKIKTANLDYEAHPKAF